MSQLYMLDTDIVSFIVKKRTNVLIRMLAVDPRSVCISVITEAEQLVGMEQMKNGSHLYRATAAFLKRVEILPWDNKAARQFAPIKHFLGMNRQQIGDLDTMIAAHAMSIGATLVTNNLKHFQRIPGGPILENWFE